MSLPEWISKDLIEDTLKKYLKVKTLDVAGMMSKFAVSVGENYCSDLFRVTVKYTTEKGGNHETISLLVKCKPEEGAKQILTNENPVFETESEMFNITITKLQELIGEKCLAADCLKAEVGAHGWLILQDLAPLGYKMAKRQAGLDMDHSFLVIERMAKMHASSAVLYEKNPHSMDSYTKGMYTNQMGNLIGKHFCNSGYQSLITAVKKWKGFEKYANKLSAMQEHIFDKTVEIAGRKPGFNVLNHGDLWINNILFQYDSMNRLCDIKFVDFQFSVFTSPAIDLLYFIYTSVRDNVEKKHLNRLLQYYHEELTSELIRLNYPKDKIPTFDQIRDDFFDRALYGLTASVTILPLVKAPVRKDATLEELFKSDDDENGLRHASYNVPEYRALLERFLPYFEKLGVMN